MNFTRLLLPFSLALLMTLTSGCFRVSSDTRALRNAALDSAGVTADETIELGVGFLTVTLAKIGAKFIEVPPEVHLLLGSVNGAECSVYQLRDGAPEFSKVLAAADSAMKKRGCERIVGVVDDRQLVAVYLPKDAGAPGRMKVTVMVLNERQLVCASARGDLKPIIDLAMSKANLPAKNLAITL